MIQKKVAVTGASGYIASHIVQQLLNKGYQVIGTVRDHTKTERFQHLLDLQNADKNLKIVSGKLDASDNQFENAFQDCSAVFHTASPCFFEGGEDDIVKPALEGTEKVLQAVLKNKQDVKSLILTSSMASVKTLNFKSEDYVYTNQDWSDIEKMRENQKWYALSKTLAEQRVQQFKKDYPEFNVAIVCPTVVQGPPLSNQVNVTLDTCVIQPIKNKDYSVGETFFTHIVDVRDVAQLHINAYEQGVQYGRYLAIGDDLNIRLYGEILQKLVKEFNLDYEIDIKEPTYGFKYKHEDNEREKVLGKPFIKAEQCLRDTIDQLKKLGTI